MENISNADIYRILKARNQIAIIWCIEDVDSVRPDLTEEQAWEVLQLADRKHDAEIGINWETLRCAAETLFGRTSKDAQADTEQNS